MRVPYSQGEPSPWPPAHPPALGTGGCLSECQKPLPLPAQPCTLAWAWASPPGGGGLGGLLKLLKATKHGSRVFKISLSPP